MGYVVPMREENELDFGEDTDGRVFYITAQQVREADEFLQSLSDDALRERYDYIYSYLTKIREFYHQAAEKGHAISLTIC